MSTLNENNDYSLEVVLRVVKVFLGKCREGEPLPSHINSLLPFLARQYEGYTLKLYFSSKGTFRRTQSYYV